MDHAPSSLQPESLHLYWNKHLKVFMCISLYVSASQWFSINFVFFGPHFMFNLSFELFFQTLPLCYLKKLFCVGVQDVSGYHEPTNWFLGASLQPQAHLLFSLLREEKQVMSRTTFFFSVITHIVQLYCSVVMIISSSLKGTCYHVILFHLAMQRAAESRKCFFSLT